MSGPDTPEVALRIESVPEWIRGFGPVKERHLEEAQARQRELLAELRR
ncbi:MAG: hypothetical protein OZ948_17620 [Deltaproteobacteria bacterium]|nr:hypothetical protein [Deltaproteobacteria bacterium]